MTDSRVYRKEAPRPERVECAYCKGSAELVTGDVIYPHRSDLRDKYFWRCKPCRAWVGCHPPATSERGGIGDGTVPKGRLADRELRDAKMLAHAAFDPLFRGGGISRRDAYRWLAQQLGKTKEDCHIGMFDVDECWRVVSEVRNRNAQHA